MDLIVNLNLIINKKVKPSYVELLFKPQIVNLNFYKQVMSTIYGTVKMPYRNPTTIKMPQLRDSDSNQRRSILPNRLGIGTKATRALPTPVVVENGRLLHSIKQEHFHLDTHAFDFVKIGTSLMQDWGNNDEIVDIYFPEIEAIIRQNVDGADHPECKVLIFDHALRSGGVLKKEMQKESE